MADEKPKPGSLDAPPPVTPTPTVPKTPPPQVESVKPVEDVEEPVETQKYHPVPDAPEKLDYSTAETGQVQSLLAGFDLGEVIKNPLVFKFLIDTINKIIGRITAPKPIDPPWTEGPNGPVVIPPPPPPPEEPPVKERLITSLRAKFYHISRKNRDISKAEFDAIVSRNSPLQAGDRVHLDCTPYDQFGIEVGPGSPELEQLVNRQVVNGQEVATLRLRWLQPMDGIGEITNEYDDYGMTPVYKVPKSAKVGEQYELGSFALEFTPAGSNRVVTSNELPSLRVRPWQE